MTATAANCACSPHATASHCRSPVPTALLIPRSPCWTLHSPIRPAPQPGLDHRVSRSAPRPPSENSMTARAAPASLAARVQSNAVCAAATRHTNLYFVMCRVTLCGGSGRKPCVDGHARFFPPHNISCLLRGRGIRPRRNARGAQCSSSIFRIAGCFSAFVAGRSAPRWIASRGIFSSKGTSEHPLSFI
jgi:hypothetical protein